MLARSLSIPEVFVDESGHLEHGDLSRAAEDRTEVFISVDHAAVLRILKTLTLDVAPEFLGDFGPWHCARADYVGEITARLHRLHESRVGRALLARRRFAAAALSSALLRCALSDRKSVV